MVPAWLLALSLLVLCAAFAVALMAITRRRRLRDEAALGELRQEREALVGTIATGLAHEIRNPLSTIIMNLQLLLEDWSNPITEREQKGARKVEVLLREARRLHGVLNSFLEFAASHQLQLGRVDLNDLLGELLDFMHPQAERAKIRFRREFAAGLPAVEADPKLLRQAVLNLLVNAQEAMPTGGQVVIRTAAEGATVRLSLQDDGPGIPPENLARIFQIYFSTKPNGTGLGLPIAKKIVEEHRGTLTVASAPGAGTTFVITLPALRPPH
jgi:signal transduction histidine kinase